MDFDKFMSHEFPRQQDGYNTRYHVLFEELSEDDIRQYIETVNVEDPIQLWRMMYHDMIGAGKHGC